MVSIPVRRRAEEVATPADERPAPEAPAPEVVARTCSMTVSEIDEAPIERTGILKGYKVEKDNYAVFEPREIAALPPPTSSDLDILAFVHLEEYALSAPKSWTWRRCSCAP